MKVLVVYFSHQDHTKRMAREIARRCEADLEEIREVMEPDSMWGSWRSQWHAWSRTDAPIILPTRNPARYELVIIGTPVWRSGISPAVRSYVAMCHSRFRQVAFFCAEGGAAGQRGFVELGRLCGQQPVATFDVERKGLPPAAHKQGLTDFMDSMRL